MGDAKWVKFEVNMFDDTKLKIIDTMSERDSIHYMWTRLLVLAGKINCGGYLYINKNIVHTIKTLSIEFNRSIDEVKIALKVLKRLDMVEFTKDKVIKIKNWEKHQNIEGLEKLKKQNNERVAKHRAKKKELRNNDIKEIDEGNVSEFINYVDNGQDFAMGEINNNETLESTEDSNYRTNNNYNLSVNIDDDIKNADNIQDKNTNNKCNVTSNYDNSMCNVTVMEQKKKENKKKKKEKKNEKKKEINNDTEIVNEEDINSNKILNQSQSEKINENVNVFAANSNTDSSDENSKKENINIYESITDEDNESIRNREVAKLLSYYEKITGITGGLNIGSLKLAISIHGYQNVKMAINKAIEVNKANMTYINGILKNWKKEGYPTEDNILMNKNKRSKKLKFNNFEPRKYDYDSLEKSLLGWDK